MDAGHDRLADLWSLSDGSYSLPQSLKIRVLVVGDVGNVSFIPSPVSYGLESVIRKGNSKSAPGHVACSVFLMVEEIPVLRVINGVGEGVP